MAPDPLQALLGSGVVPSVSFPLTSRYAAVGIATYSPVPAPGQDEVPVAFLRRRLVPPPERFSLLYEYACVEGDRRDLVAAALLSDAELWWRIADANGAIDPATLTVPPGKRLRITMAEDIPGGIGG
jgi:hypothetical protein